MEIIPCAFTNYFSIFISSQILYELSRILDLSNAEMKNLQTRAKTVCETFIRMTPKEKTKTVGLKY